ncbi:MAG TPA: FAD/NAD(P)-binding protein [Pseudomonas sp.]|uniref:FAD/NAD(P)-binding protein n=1 Tax=Pseudomonas sp. TaxID=306 RepID=UPI002ED96AB8
MELNRDDSGEETAIKIGIVGCGSRGLTVLERLCALAAIGSRPVEITVYDPHRPGPGVHSVEQPEYLMLNTVASQISMFPDQAALGGFGGRQGPDFYEWCVRFKSTGRALRANEFLPRQWLGEYLAWTYDVVIAGLPSHVTVIHQALAVDNVERDDAGGFVLTAQGSKYSVDWLVLTVGHAAAAPVVDNRAQVTRLHWAYPQPFSLEGIDAGIAVGVEGLGLSAMDVVAGLTVGRGGRFVHNADQSLRYEPSGNEPRVFMFSRSGLPFRTRPDIHAYRVAAPALIFTLSAVDELRAAHPLGLDFEAHVLPLIKAEMLAHYFGMIGALRGECATSIMEEVAAAFYSQKVQSKAAELAQRFGVQGLDPSVFDPQYLTAPVEHYQDWVKAFISADVQESLADLDHSPVKAAVEVWRSCREQLRRVVDNHGLTADSHRVFFSQYAPLVNRMVAGPQKERHQELLALAEAGIVQWVHSSRVLRNEGDRSVSIRAQGRGEAVTLDALVYAHVHDNRNAANQPKVVSHLREIGVIHSLTPDGFGLNVDGNCKALPNLWITGPIVEGATYYNHYVPSSGSYSRAFVDADRIAREILGL